MSQFLRLLDEDDKAAALLMVSSRRRAGESDTRHFEVAPESFAAVPGQPFAYWVSESVRNTFTRLPPLEGGDRTAKQGLATADDFRFVRLWWEASGGSWSGFAKGGVFSQFYADVYLTLNWSDSGAEICNLYKPGSDKLASRPQNTEFFSRPGLTWPLRTQGGLSLRAMPAGCAFGHKGPAAFVAGDDHEELLALLTLVNSRAFGLLVSIQMAFGSYEVGVVQRTPIPTLTAAQRRQCATLARRAWSLKRTLDTTTETSHAFLLPAVLRSRLGAFDPSAIEAELAQILGEIDAVAFDLYGFHEADRQMSLEQVAATDQDNIEADGDDEDIGDELLTNDALLSWAIGVVFGRFDWHLANGDRSAPPDPEPFEPLPVKSPGMLPEGAEPFHAHPGILVDDPGHPHDLTRLIEEVLTRIGAPVPDGVRGWLQRDFFPLHLQRYSKSRRKGPIYWPLSTTSGSYTLWAYYPSLNSQTLYIAVNDFIEPKLKHLGSDISALRSRGTERSRDDERRFEALQTFELELMELRDALLKLAPTYAPNSDDGVQITAAPLWLLHRHKPWQKILKETWTQLERGAYDWAHLAMSYWPARVRDKCKTDKSVAIAHGLEDLRANAETKSKHVRSKKRAGDTQ